MNHEMQGAIRLLDRSENARAHDNAIMYAQQATACALIAIAEELQKMNNRAEYQDERQEARRDWFAEHEEAEHLVKYPGLGEPQ